MDLLKIIRMSIFQLVSVLFLVLFLLGLLNTHFSDKNNYCVMTYMFEYPQFVRISVPENNIYPQYGLYAYGEGRVTEKARKMWFDGIPVLFLPGNSGSHMQGRSLASVALRKALSDIYDFHFDFFTVNYNEDLSGLYGGVLYSETEFAAACINRVLSLYKSNKYTKTVPTSVILIGHSMGGVIAKRLQAHPLTIDRVDLVITLAAPLEAPVLNADLAMNEYYKTMEYEWDVYVNSLVEVKNRKTLLSFGNGPRDILMPSSLTSSKDSDISVLTTSVPGVWLSPDHVSIVWCKQLVLAINKFLFSIVDLQTKQMTGDKQAVVNRARMYFQANHSMTLDPNIIRPNVTMSPDAFWYEDNRRIYQVARPEVDKTIYLMIRLVSFHQNRFVAIESVNAEDKDWVFGCNAQYTQGTHRYCNKATSLTELSRWTGAATNFGKRKLATIHLHDIIENNPTWTHVVVKVSPTRKPIVLNVDINDHASRQLTVELPYGLSQTVIKEETEPNSLYYELVLPGFDTVYQAYLLYVEPTSSCKASQYHVSAEVHVPWAKNNEYFHYFTQAMRSPMKLRLFNSNPNVTQGLEAMEHVKVTLLLDPQCTFTISISSSWYHRLAQLTRNYTPVLIPYIAAIILLATRSNIQNLYEKGSCVNIHSALMSESVKPYYALVFSRLGTVLLTSVPLFAFIIDNASWNNLELRYFSRSLLVLPAYMTALGLVNVAAAAVLAVMVFSSQLAHRLLFRIMCRGGPALAERIASALQRAPLVVSAALVCATPLSCGAASLAAGAAFYAFMLSKMFEEYLEDYVYKLMAKVAAKVCRIFKSKKSREDSLNALVPTENEVSDEDKNENVKAVEGTSEDENEKNKVALKAILEADTSLVATEKSLVETEKSLEQIKNNPQEDKDKVEENNTESESLVPLVEEEKEKESDSDKTEHKSRKRRRSNSNDDLSNLNFHMMIFFLWMIVTLVNVPALLTWARNFKYNMVLRPDTSYHTGLVMSACSACIWQMEGPRKKLKHYETLSAIIFTMAVLTLAIGPFTLYIVNYGVTLIVFLITLQQLFDKEEVIVEEASENDSNEISELNKEDSSSTKESSNNKENDQSEGSSNSGQTENKSSQQSEDQSNEECNVCNESRIYNVFKNLRDKFSFNEEEL